MPSHFTRFLKARTSPRLIIVSEDLDIGTAIDDSLLTWAATEAEEWIGHLGFLPI